MNLAVFGEAFQYTGQFVVGVKFDVDTAFLLPLHYLYFCTKKLRQFILGIP